VEGFPTETHAALVFRIEDGSIRHVRFLIQIRHAPRFRIPTAS